MIVAGETPRLFRCSHPIVSLQKACHEKVAPPGKVGPIADRVGGYAALDEKSQQQLQKLIGEIERAIDLPASETGAGETSENEQEGEGPLAGEVQDLVLKFEAEHPQITSALNQVASALANLGI